MKGFKLHPIIALALKLLAVTAVVSLALAGVHELTAPYIAGRQDEALNAALGEVFDSSFYTKSGDAFAWDDVTLTPMSNMASSFYDPELPHGFAVEVTTGGYVGDIRLLVGIKLEFDEEAGYMPIVAGVQMVEQHETAGVFATGDTAPFLSQFAGEQAGIVLGDGIDAVSGATVTSKAVTTGVNQALDAVQSYIASVTGGDDIG